MDNLVALRLESLIDSVFYFSIDESIYVEYIKLSAG